MHKAYVFIITAIAIFAFILLLSGCKTTAQVPTPAIANSATRTTTGIPVPSTATITTIAPSSPTPTPFVNAPITIDKTFDGQEVRANLVKFTGSVSSPETTVKVNNVQAAVNTDGSYHAYLDLVPGKHAIEVTTTTNQTSTSEKITVTFRPPLVVRLGWQTVNADYTKVPVEIDGAVSDPAATVTVNNNRVIVDADGTFTTQVQMKVGSNPVEVVAELNGEIDTDLIQLDLVNDNLVPPPGLGFDYSGAGFSNLNPVNIKVGETVTEDFDLLIKKDLFGAHEGFQASVIRTSQPHSQDKSDELPMLPSLTVNFDPPSYSIYPKIEYHSPVVIKAGLDAIPGDYYFTIYYSLNGGPDEDYITIAVQP